MPNNDTGSFGGEMRCSFCGKTRSQACPPSSPGPGESS